MKRITSNELVSAGAKLARLSEIYESSADKTSKFDKTQLLGTQNAKAIKAFIKKTNTELGNLPIKVTRVAITDALKTIDGKSTHADASKCLESIRTTLNRELRSITLLCVDSSKLNEFEQISPLFGEGVDEAFPSISYEVQEAGYCVAFNRNTAVVFHLMRVLEIALRAINASLGLPPPTGNQKNWGNLLQAINVEMTHRNQNANAGWHANDRSIFEDLFASLDAVRSAWRNATMHIERNYDEDEARHLFLVVKQLMKKVADRMDEEGKPTA